MYTPKTKGEKRLLLAFLILSGLALLALAIFYFANPRSIIGDALVNTQNGTPVEFPPPNISPIYVKPVTIMFITSVIFAFSLFSLIQRRLDHIPRSVRALFLLISVAVLAISSYETLFNFVIWGSSMLSHGDPDTIVNAYPVSSVKVNLVFATKSFVALIFVSYFSIVTFKSSLDRENI